MNETVSMSDGHPISTSRRLPPNRETAAPRDRGREYFDCVDVYPIDVASAQPGALMRSNVVSFVWQLLQRSAKAVGDEMADISANAVTSAESSLASRRKASLSRADVNAILELWTRDEIPSCDGTGGATPRIAIEVAVPQHLSSSSPPSSCCHDVANHKICFVDTSVIHAAVAFNSPALLPLTDLLSAAVWIVPVNDYSQPNGGAHWSLLVVERSEAVICQGDDKRVAGDGVSPLTIMSVAPSRDALPPESQHHHRVPSSRTVRRFIAYHCDSHGTTNAAAAGVVLSTLSQALPQLLAMAADDTTMTSQSLSDRGVSSLRVNTVGQVPAFAVWTMESCPTRGRGLLRFCDGSTTPLSAATAAAYFEARRREGRCWRGPSVTMTTSAPCAALVGSLLPPTQAEDRGQGEGGSVEDSFPQQRNATDCGGFMCMAAISLWSHYSTPRSMGNSTASSANGGPPPGNNGRTVDAEPDRQMNPNPSLGRLTTWRFDASTVSAWRARVHAVLLSHA